MIATLLALQLLAATSATAASLGGASAPSSTREPAQLVLLEGLPADTLVRGAFMAGFRGELACEKVAVETGSGSGPWTAAKPLTNCFKWSDVDVDETVWQLSVSVGAPPPVVIPARGDRPRRVIESRRRSRGMIAAFTVTSPARGMDRPRTVGDRVAFAFPAPGENPEGEPLGVSATGYVFPWDEAGRVVARLALEAMLRQRGDVGPRERVALRTAQRAESGR